MTVATPSRMALAAPYLFNCFWLVAPILVFNLLFARQLPAAFQPDVFWKDVPPLIGIPENIFRTCALALTVLLPLPLRNWRQKGVGLALYLAGLAAYLAAWMLAILLPGSGWSTGIPGFMAPAYTPALWLGGIGLLGNDRLVRGLPLVSWTYGAAATLFLVFHNIHTLMIYLRAQ